MKSSRRPHCPAAALSRRCFIAAASVSAAGAFSVRAEKEGDYHIGAYTRAWGQRDYRVAFDGMAEAGYREAGVSVHAPEGRMVRVIDRDSTVEEAAALGVEAASRGLSLASLSAGSFEADKPFETGVAQLRHLLELAAASGAAGLQVNDPAKPEVEAAFYEVVAECCDHAAGLGVSLNIHPHGSSGAHIRERIEAVGHPSLKLMYDPGNVGYYSEGAVDPVEDAGYLDGAVYGMSVKDYELPRNVNIDPGTGLVDFPRLIARLRVGGFTKGPLLVECLQPGELAEVTTAARRAREFVESIVSGLY